MKIIGNKIIYLDSVDSTNNYLKNELNTSNPGNGLLVCANEQISGRGQRENSWESDSNKNILLSFVVYPDFIEADRQFILSKAISLALSDFISQYTDNVSVKWPNDIFVDNKKIAGVLIENSIKGSEISNSIIGIGININQHNFSNNLPNPVSLSTLTGKTYKINELLPYLIDKLDYWYKQLILNDTETIDKLYIRRLFRYMQMNEFIVKNKIIKAKIIGVDKFGKLIIETENSFIKKFAFKEILYCI